MPSVDRRAVPSSVASSRVADTNAASDVGSAPSGHSPIVRPVAVSSWKAARTDRPSLTTSLIGATNEGGLTAVTSTVETTAR